MMIFRALGLNECKHEPAPCYDLDQTETMNERGYSRCPCIFQQASVNTTYESTTKAQCTAAIQACCSLLTSMYAHMHGCI